MTYRSQRRRGGLGCLAWVVALVWILLIALIAYQFFFRDQASRYLGQWLGQQARQGVEAQGERSADQQLEGSGSAVASTVAGLPSGEVQVSEAQANDYIAANIKSVQGVQSATVHFLPGKVQLDIRALGTDNTATMGLAVQDGRIIAVNPEVDGPLGQFVSAEDLANTFAQQINNQLASQGRRITDVRVEQGQLVVVVE